MLRKQKGFTIVELLIVIVVIGILAAIVIVAFMGVQAKADTVSRLSEMKAWVKQYQIYATLNNKYPDVPRDEYYCLGTGFPDKDGSGLGNCRDLEGYSTRHQVNPTLNAALATVGSLPGGPRTSPGDDALGPFAVYYTGGNVVISDVFKGTTCPQGTDLIWPYSGHAVMCQIDIPAVN
jgi:prepilin-type N-terminal cleavage/methylation domain-containing protein